MGHDKLRKFAENEGFACLLQPQTRPLLAEGYDRLLDHPVKGRWADFFAGLEVAGAQFAAAPAASPAPRQEPLPPLSAPAPAASPLQDTPPLVLELGCGKGEYTVALAEMYPDRRFIGVDIKGARLWKGAKYATLHHLPNVAFLRARIEFITAFFAPGEVSEIWLTFSDPQIRKENSRLTSPLFLERYRNFLAPGGLVHLKTDSRFLFEYTLALCRENGLEVVSATTDLYGGVSASIQHSPSQASGEVFEGAEPAPEVRRVQTFYESIFREQGYRINYLCFRLDHDGPVVSPSAFDADYWRSVEGPRQLFGRDTAETRRQKLKESAGQ